MYDIVIIGGGASGIMCALQAYTSDKKILILEFSNKLLKKILVTGNGRCNITNKHLSNNDYFSNNLDKVFLLFNKYDTNKTINYLSNLGLILKEEDAGRMYPISNQATTVMDILTSEIIRHKIEVKSNVEVINLDKNSNIFIITDKDGNTYKSENVVIATGGISHYSKEIPYTGYKLLESMGHTITSLSPSLVRITSDNKHLYRLKGQRVKASLTLYINDSKIKNEEGEVLFNELGLSGICIFNLSRLINKDNNQYRINIDFIPNYSTDDLKEIINSRIKNSIILEDLLLGLFHKKIITSILLESGINPNDLVSSINDNIINKIINTIKNFSFNVTGKSGYKDSQVTAGGAKLDEFTNNLESIICSNLYACGEVLDVDGICGGFNLQWAWTSGAIVGESLKGVTK